MFSMLFIIQTIFSDVNVFLLNILNFTKGTEGQVHCPIHMGQGTCPSVPSNLLLTTNIWICYKYY